MSEDIPAPNRPSGLVYALIIAKKGFQAMAKAASDALKEVQEAENATDRLIAAYKVKSDEVTNLRAQLEDVRSRIDAGQTVDTSALEDVIRNAQEIEDKVNELLGADPTSGVGERGGESGGDFNPSQM